MNADLTFQKLRGLIVTKYGSLNKFANVLGYSPQNLSNKLNGNIELRRSEINDWCKLLGIPKKEIGTYFFNER